MFTRFLSLIVVVSIVTKIRILKQITTKLIQQRKYMRCIYSNKDKNFKANHNRLCVGRRVVMLYL